MSDKHDQKAQTEKVAGGGHIGGTKYGQTNDAKTTRTVREDGGDKARDNDGLNSTSPERKK
jgi:hypothetical protein